MTQIKTLADVIKFVNEYWEAREITYSHLDSDYIFITFLDTEDDDTTSSGDF